MRKRQTPLGDEIRGEVQDLLAFLDRIEVFRDRVEVDDGKDALIFFRILDINEIFERAKIVADVEPA